MNTKQKNGNSPYVLYLRTVKRFFREPSLVLGSLIIVFFILVSLLPSQIVSIDPNKQNLLNSLAKPSQAHLFGTDELGRDLFSRVVHGTPTALILAVGSMVVAYLVALPFGLAAGYYGGKLDRALSYITDSFLTFPSIVLSIVIVSIIGTGERGLFITLVVTKAPSLARFIRGSVLQHRKKEYIEGARSLGCSAAYIMVRHILPNILGSSIIIISLFASEALLTTAALGFLGLGVQPPNPEWGTMLSRSRNYFMVASHLMVFPGLAISTMILGFNLFGDGLRDFLDSKKQ